MRNEFDWGGSLRGTAENGVREVIITLVAPGADVGSVGLLSPLVGGEVDLLHSDLVKATADEPVERHETMGVGTERVAIVGGDRGKLQPSVMGGLLNDLLDCKGEGV